MAFTTGRPGVQMPQAEINMIPLIDVMLVLLVIFMVTAPMAPPAAIDLPSVGKASTPPVAPIQITVKADGTLSMRDKDGIEETPGIKELGAKLHDAQIKNPAQAVVIAGDRSVRYEVVLSVMDELQRAQVGKIGLLVNPSQTKGL